MKWGGGSCDDVSVWGVESSIFTSMQAIKVGEVPERSQVSKEDTPSDHMQLGYDGMAGGGVGGRWIIIGKIKLLYPVILGIIWH